MAEMFVMPGRPKREFRHVETAEIYSARCAEPLKHRRRICRAEILANFTPTGRQAARTVEHVLMR